MRVTPINMAEAIIEPFWDPAFGALAQWTVQPGEPHGLEVEQFWCYVAVRWARRPERGPALSMSRECAVDVTGYDDLLVSLVAPEGSILGVRVLTDKGELAYSAPPATALKKEHAFDLQGAGRLRRLVLELATDKDGIAIGWLNWIGLRNRAFLERYERQWKRFDPRWEAYLKPESYEPTFKPVYGFLVNEEDLAGLRRRHEALFPGREDSPIFNMAAQSERQVPEDFIGEFVKCRLTSIFNRDRDGEERVTALGSNAALAGVLGRDKRLQRLAARYGM
ncbi:MAG: hypothetical protein HY343_10395, partial [Lentisphaerae bacterium]|nr:hypothetical protein [Lentisphaerota bacterium]